VLPLAQDLMIGSGARGGSKSEQRLPASQHFSIVHRSDFESP
jgi:hypothetical protein